MRRPMTLGVIALAAGLLMRPVPGHTEAPAPETFGVTSEIVYTLQAFAFEPYDPNVAAVTGSGSRYCTAPCVFAAPVFLPAGARVSRVVLDACDGDAVDGMSGQLLRIGTMESAFDSLVTVTTGTTADPGCTLFGSLLPTLHTIDNLNNSYMLVFQIGGSSSNTRFSAVRIFYRLQVSPAPATATFGDVPASHPFFQFVEAVAAAGITAGCGGGNYCPDAPLTRGQMAVFLSKGLGLHFAP